MRALQANWKDRRLFLLREPVGVVGAISPWNFPFSTLSRKVEPGPLLNQAALTKVETHLQDARGKGARILLVGQRHMLGATFFEPATPSIRSPR